jgi:hypothetical protein
MKRARYVEACACLFISASLIACGGEAKGTEPPPPGEVTFDPAVAPAASMVKVDGLELDACPLRTSEIRVGGQVAPTVLNARHEALMRLPLFYDEQAKWPAPPDGPQDVELFCNGTLWQTLPAAITITELASAPGTTEALVADYQQVIAEYKALTEALAPDPSVLRQLFTATFAAVEELVAGDDPNSLLAQLEALEQTEPDVLALMDAVYAENGVDEAVAAFRARIQELSAEVAPPVPAIPWTPADAPPQSVTPKRPQVFELPFPISVPDDSLAQLMRTHDGIHAFANDFIAPTAESFGTFEGLLSLVVKSKLASTINAVLSLLDFTLNKVVVSAMPSSLDAIELQQVPPLLENSEVTSSTFTVQASNVPEVLTITDITSAILMTIGLDDAPGASASGELLDWTKLLEDKLKDVGKLFLDTLSKFLKDTFGAPGGFEYDLEAFAIVPQMRFEATGQTRELYSLYPQRSQVIEPLSEQLQWQASDTYWGTAAVYVAPSPGSFGPHNTESEHIRVQVGQLALVLERYTVDVPEGFDTTVGVKLSHAPPDEEGTLEVFAIPIDGDTDIRVTSTLPMYFDDSNWDVFQYLTLAAAQDDDTDDDYRTFRVFTVVDAVVEEPKNIEADLTAREADDDRIWFVLDPSSVDVPEGETAEVSVKLSQAPSDDVSAVVTHAYGDADLQVQSPTLMRFDEDNWDDYQTITLYADPDDDLVEGTAQFLVSANPPAKVDDTYITATEDEGVDTLHYRWTIDDGITRVIDGQTYYVSGRTKYVVTGVIPVMLNHDADPETILGTATGRATRTTVIEGEPHVTTGTSTLTVRNHWADTVCYCGSPVTEHCHTNPDPDNIHTLAVDTQLNLSASAAVVPKQEARRDIVVIVGEDAPYSVSYNCGVKGTVSAELR